MYACVYTYIYIYIYVYRCVLCLAGRPAPVSRGSTAYPMPPPPLFCFIMDVLLFQ